MGSRALQRDGPPRGRLRRARPRRARRPRRSRTPTATRTLAADLLAVLDDRGIERALLAGASMGAHTLVRFALDHGDRVAGLVVVTPAFDPDDTQDEERRLGALGRALGGPARRAAWRASSRPTATPKSPERWHETIYKVLRQRLGAHEHPEAVADALRAVPRSRPFEAWSELAELALPADRRRQPRRGRPRAPLRGRRALRRGDPGRRAALGGARRVADGLAGQPALRGDRGARRERSDTDPPAAHADAVR